MEPYIQDGKLYLNGGKIKQKGGPLGAKAAQIIPVGLQVLGKIFGSRRNSKKKKKKILSYG